MSLGYFRDVGQHISHYVCVWRVFQEMVESLGRHGLCHVSNEGDGSNELESCDQLSMRCA